MILSWKKADKKESMLYHLYTILENANYRERKQISGCLWTKKEKEDLPERERYEG